MEKHSNSPVYQTFLNGKHVAGKQTEKNSSTLNEKFKEQISISNNSLYQSGLKSKMDPILNFNMKSEYSFPSDNQQNNFNNRDFYVVQKQHDLKFAQETTAATVPPLHLIHHGQRKIVNNEFSNNNNIKVNQNSLRSNLENQESQTQRLKLIQQQQQQQDINKNNNLFPLYGPDFSQNIQQPQPSLPSSTNLLKPPTSHMVNYSIKPASNAQINRLLATPKLQPNSKEENAKILSMIRNENKYNELLVENALFIDSPIHLLMNHHKNQRLLKMQNSTHHDDVTKKVFNHTEDQNHNESTTNLNENKNKNDAVILDFTQTCGDIAEKEVITFTMNFVFKFS